MARYFFDIHDRRHQPDGYGTELDDLAAAQFEAVVLAGYILRDYAADVLQCEGWHLTVTNERRETVFRIDFMLTGPNVEKKTTRTTSP